jgi:hypothetical protein
MHGESEAPSRPKTFFSQLAGAFSYPFKGNGPWLIIGWAVFMLAMDFARYICRSAGVLGFMGLGMISLFITGYLCAYMLKVVLSSAAGEDEPPDWPNFGNWWDDIAHPILLVAGTIAVCFLPAIACLFHNLWMEFRGGAVREGPGSVLLLLLGVGSFFLPMGMLGVAMHDSFRGLNPLLMLRSIARVPGPYMVAWVFMLFAAALRQALSAHPPRIFIISTLLQGPLGLYFLIVEMRIIGLIYSANSRRLDWFDEASDRRGRAKT